MDEINAMQSRSLPEKIDMYIIGDDGSISTGIGCEPDVYIEESASGKLFDKDVALYIREKFGCNVGVMRDSNFRATPREYNTHKMILGKVNLP